MSDSVLVQDLTTEANESLRKFKGSFTTAGFRRFAGHILPSSYPADSIRRTRLRPDDIWVCTVPRSGTTMTQEIIWLLQNNLDYATATKINLDTRHHHIENPYLWNKVPISKAFPDDIPSPRFFKTHLPLSLLPPSLLNSCKVVYVARDPRDVAVSYYHHNRLFQYMSYCGDFKSYWQLFVNDLIPYNPYFSHVKQAWEQREHPNMLFIFYEDMIKNLSAVIKRIAIFFGKECSESEIRELADHMQFDKFKNNESVNREHLHGQSEFMNPDEGNSFIRKGKAGGWRDHFNEEMRRQANQWMEHHLRDTDLCFPST